jgi:GntR family transcriptional regulator
VATDPPYRAIADQLRAQIERGEITPGRPLLPAKQIAEQFGVSHTTIHKAFAVLQDEGLLDIRAGVGVFVRAWQPIVRDATTRLAGKQWKRGRSIWQADLGDREMHVDTRVRTVKAADVTADVRALLDAPRYLVRDRVFTVEKQRIQLAASYLDAAAVGGTQIAEIDTGPGGTYARLAELGLEPTLFCEDVRARFPDAQERETLRVGPRRIVLDVLREAATEQERTVEVTHMRMLADAYVLRYRFGS